MTNATVETRTTRKSDGALNQVSGGQSSSAARLFLVRECVPEFFAHKRPLRTAYVKKPDEALDLHWVERLPGEKRIQFVHGQIFVIQRYLGYRLLRAHICRNDELCTDSGH
jgi:hypothetical protein